MLSSQAVGKYTGYLQEKCCSTLITVELSVMYVLCMFVCESMTHYFLYVHRGVSGFFFPTPAPLMCADVARACALSETVFHSGENS